MAFDGLSEKLQAIVEKIRGTKTINEESLKETLREVRLALLEADVNFKVVKDFVAVIKERALGMEVQQGLTAGQQIIKIVHEELIKLLGATQAKLEMSPQPPTIIMLVGLQGAGKTTSVGKLANHLRKAGKKPLMVAADVYRPAAITQLEVLGKQLDVPVFSLPEEKNPVKIAEQALVRANALLCDVVLVDTAGRLHIDEELMEELKHIKAAINPQQILLTIDAMTGQDAVSVAETFNAALGINGLIVTKLDGDARGGAVLSVKSVTGCPIMFTGAGEKLDALEPFYPDRMASRILGMGDVLTLIETVTKNIDEKATAKITEDLKNDGLTLDTFLQQMQQIKKMGSLQSILSMIPGMGKLSKKLEGADIDNKEFAKVEAIIRSMTPREKKHPNIINGSRRKRIAAGSGTRVQDVNKLLKSFEESKKAMKQMMGMTKYASKGKKLPFMN